VSGRPRFFCEHCGAEVPRNAARCGVCGRHFSSVLCPKCGFSGSEALFSRGCPACGYSAPPERGAPTRSERGMSTVGGLPLWVYAVALAALVAVLASAFVLFKP
jgi:predicted RNA-binding Zn-ribbon protein involved in translation (DUF1610 family)